MSGGENISAAERRGNVFSAAGLLDAEITNAARRAFWRATWHKS